MTNITDVRHVGEGFLFFAMSGRMLPEVLHPDS